MNAAYSAYVPCCNNAATVRRAVESVLEQSIRPAEVLVVDDGSSDASLAALAGLPVRIVRHDGNLGRGAVRARAMRELSQAFVLCCDATNVLPPDFFLRALRPFAAERVAAVCGRIAQPPGGGAVARWRGRHLFKLGVRLPPRRDAVLATYGTLVRASAVAAAGGYDARLRHTEDADLGGRLRAAGFDVVFDPELSVLSIAPARLGPTLERYWRWYAGSDETVTWRGYVRNLGYAARTMAVADLRAGDPASALISLLAPHYQFWKSRLRRASRR